MFSEVFILSTTGKYLFRIAAVLPVAAAVLCSLAYIVIRSTMFFYAEYALSEKVLAVFLILAEGFVIVHGIGYALSVMKASVYESKQLKITHEPVNTQNTGSVAVLVAARHEPGEILESTFITLNNLCYENKTLYFLDDSSEEQYRKEAEELADEYGLVLFRRTKPRHGAKAGIVNDCLETLKEDYVAIFDADQNPMPDFLNQLIPYLEKDPGLAYIQTPQYYSNISEMPVARASAFQQAVFYEYICEGKSISEAMFCCGTNVVFRTRALLDAGGFDETSITEDFATSLKLLEKGWRSLYFPHVCVFGMAPETLSAYFQQQFRWAAGTLGVFRKLLLRFIVRPFSLKPLQWIEYFFSGSFYLVGGALFFLMLCPILYIFFNQPSFFAVPEVYLLAFVPYIVFSLSVFYVLLGKRRYKIKDLFLGQMLGVITFPVYIKASFAALFGFRLSFGVTSKGRDNALAYLRLWPQLFMWFLNFIAVVWAVNRFIYEHQSAVVVNAVWAFYHFLLLSFVFYFNRGILCEQRV